MARNGLLTSVAIGVAVLPCIARPTLAQSAPSPATPQSAAAAPINGVAALRATLRNPEIPPAERDEAARRLLVLRTPEATAALREAILDVANPRGQQSVARALGEDDAPDPAFITALRAMIGSDAAASEAAARALANYRGDPDARRHLLAAAADPKLPVASRALVIRSMAPLADRRTVEELLNIVIDDAEPAAVRNAAADELVEMTGHAAAARDPQRWRQWWSDNADKPQAQLDYELLAVRAARLNRLEPRHERLVAEMRALLAASFQAAPKEDQLLKYLRSPEADVRVLGASLVVDLFTENKPIPDSARQELRKMVGDSDRNVRLQVANALHDINDSVALDAVLNQLAVERDPAVRAALAEALAPMGSARAVGPLVKLLADENTTVVQSAAAALRGLRDQLREPDQKAARDVSLALNQVLQKTSAPGMRALREQVVAAMAAWAHPDAALVDAFRMLLRPNESAAVRQQALQYFGKMGSESSWPADIITRSDALRDPDESIRLAAVEALGKVAQADHAQSLFERLADGELPAAEPSPAVHLAAWNALTAMFPTAFDVQQLNAWADRFQDQPERRLTILEALRGKLIEQKRADELAVVQQNIGDANMKLGRFDKAAVEFRALLDSPARQNKPNDQLVKQLLEAYLGATEYVKAVQFAAEQIAANPAYQTFVGPTLAYEAERLGNTEAAIRLATLALEMDPPLVGASATRLVKVRSGLANKAPSTTPSP